LLERSVRVGCERRRRHLQLVEAESEPATPPDNAEGVPSEAV
jgi:hypothetical protein